MNIPLFRSKMILYGDTQRKIADVLHLSDQSIGDKLYGDKWRQHEIRQLKDRWHLTAEDIDAIFFSDDNEDDSKLSCHVRE